MTVLHLAELIKEASLRGVDTKLSTNGIYLTKEKLYEIKDYLNSIAFPFESCNDELNHNIRGTNNHRELVTLRRYWYFNKYLCTQRKSKLWKFFDKKIKY